MLEDVPFELDVVGNCDDDSNSSCQGVPGDAGMLDKNKQPKRGAQDVELADDPVMAPPPAATTQWYSPTGQEPFNKPEQVQSQPAVGGGQMKTRTCTFGFRVAECLGRGTFGKVFLATLPDGSEVAIKHMECRPGAILSLEQRREIGILRKLGDHESIVKLLEVTKTSFSLDLIFERCAEDFRTYLARMARKLAVGSTLQEAFCLEKVWAFSWHLLDALAYVHEHRIVHRDIKPANVLVSARGDQVKLADFGWARALPNQTGERTRPLTPGAFTLWYRSPDVMLGDDTYGTPSDTWAMGLVIVEMCEMKGPVFRASSEIGMLFEVFKTLGTPTNSSWPGVTKLPSFTSTKFPCFPQPTAFPWNSRSVRDPFLSVLVGLLRLAPCQRNTARCSASIVKDLCSSK